MYTSPTTRFNTINTLWQSRVRRNRTLFDFTFRSHYCVRRTATQYLCYGWGLYALCKLTNTWYVYTAHMSPTLNGGSALQRYKHSNGIKIHNGIMLWFLPRTATWFNLVHQITFLMRGCGSWLPRDHVWHYADSVHMRKFALIERKVICYQLEFRK